MTKTELKKKTKDELIEMVLEYEIIDEENAKTIKEYYIKLQLLEDRVRHEVCEKIRNNICDNDYYFCYGYNGEFKTIVIRQDDFNEFLNKIERGEIW